MCNKAISPNPLTALFGVVPPATPITRHQAEAIAFSTLLARHLKLISWKKVTPPSHRHWVEEVMSNLKLEQLKYNALATTHRNHKVWQLFLSYFMDQLPNHNIL